MHVCSKITFWTEHLLLDEGKPLHAGFCHKLVTLHVQRALYVEKVFCCIIDVPNFAQRQGLKACMLAPGSLSISKPCCVLRQKPCMLAFVTRFYHDACAEGVLTLCQDCIALMSKLCCCCRIAVPSFAERHGLKACMVAPTKIIAGLGMSLGIDRLHAPGTTGLSHVKSHALFEYIAWGWAVCSSADSKPLSPVHVWTVTCPSMLQETTRLSFMSRQRRSPMHGSRMALTLASFSASRFK